MTTSRPVFRTKLCDLLGIEYPILQSGMGTIAGPDLAAEVSNAGGLGILAGALLTADQLREAIRTIQARTDKPFGVNTLLQCGLGRMRPHTRERQRQDAYDLLAPVYNWFTDGFDTAPHVAAPFFCTTARRQHYDAIEVRREVWQGDAS
ncbi:MAG: nitronate monooxygenase [Candidatus Tectomicrobia bacterium]